MKKPNFFLIIKIPWLNLNNLGSSNYTFLWYKSVHCFISPRFRPSKDPRWNVREMEAIRNHVLRESAVVDKDKFFARSCTSPFRQINIFLVISFGSKKHYVAHIRQNSKVLHGLSACFTVISVFLVKIRNTLGVYNLKQTVGKGKGHPRTGHEDPEEEWRYSCTLSLTSTLVVSQHHASGTLPPGNTRYLFYRRLGGNQGQSERVQKISPSHRDSNPRPSSPEPVAILTELPRPSK